MITYSLFRDEEGSSVTLVVPGRGSLSATDTHPNWERILQVLVVEQSQDADRILGLFDLSQAAGQKFQRLTERVTVNKGRVYFDGVALHNALSKQIVRFVEEEVEDWKPLASFLEKVMTNPNEHSREQLYGWVEKQDITLTQDGDMVAYKGVESDGNGGYRSTSAGTATVDGEVHTGKIPNYVGAVVEMPRDVVVHDPYNHCSTGLHIGSFSYAEVYGRGGCMLEVHVNPRDVVSVPNDGDGEKARVCRYRVASIIETPHQVPVLDGEEDYEDDLDPDGDLDAYWKYIAGEEPVENVAAPSEEEFNTMLKRAKRRRRNFVKYATKHGPWTFVGDEGDDPKDRHNWSKGV